MLTKGMKRMIENFIINECDEIIIDIMSKKLNVDIRRDGDDIKFTVKFSDTVIAEDKINIK